MQRIVVITSVLLLATSVAFAQSDEEVVEALRTSIKEALLEQLPDVLPKSFLDSGLSPTDRERIVLQLVNDSAACFTETLVAYAAFHEKPLSDFITDVDDGAIRFEGDLASDYEQMLGACLLEANQAAGIINEQ